MKRATFLLQVSLSLCLCCPAVFREAQHHSTLPSGKWILQNCLGTLNVPQFECVCVRSRGEMSELDNSSLCFCKSLFFLNFFLKKKKTPTDIWLLKWKVFKVAFSQTTLSWTQFQFSSVSMVTQHLSVHIDFLEDASVGATKTGPALIFFPENCMLTNYNVSCGGSETATTHRRSD